MVEPPKKISSVEEYYVLFSELEKLSEMEVLSVPEKARFSEIVELLDAFEKELFPSPQGTHRSGGRF